MLFWCHFSVILVTVGFLRILEDAWDLKTFLVSFVSFQCHFSNIGILKDSRGFFKDSGKILVEDLVSFLCHFRVIFQPWDSCGFL